MAKIIGNTTATPNPRPDWNQTDETKADFIKNKPIVDQVYSAESTNAQSGIAVAEIITSINKIIEDETKARTDADSGFNDRITALESNFGDGENTAESQIEAAVNGVRDELNEYKETNDVAVKANADAIDVLNGNTSVEGSVDKKIALAINDFATKVSDDKTVNTYKELIDYAASHGSEFTELVGEVDANTKAIEALNGDTSTIGSIDNKLEGKVDKVSGKGLSANDYTTEEKNKLSNIEDGAQVNIQPDWNQTDETKEDYIKNKPTLEHLHSAEDINSGVLSILHGGTGATTVEGAKQTLGIDKVPNVTTNDQTPTYSDTSTLATLSSGEKLNVALQKIKCAITNLINHLNNKSNPHGVTASQVGLGNVNNTSDTNKPVSAAQATAIADAKSAGTIAQTNLNAHISNKSNPHGVTAAQIGAAPEQHDHSASSITSGTLNIDRLPIAPVSKGGTGATTAEGALENLGAAPAYTYGTDDLTAGSSSLDTGTLYFVYE